MNGVKAMIRESILARALTYVASHPGSTRKEIERGIHPMLACADGFDYGKLDHVLGSAAQKGTLRRIRVHNHSTGKKTWRYYIP